MSNQHSRFYEIRKKLEAYQPETPFTSFAWEFFLFGCKQAWACLFGALLLGLLIITKLIWSPDWPVTRYDCLFVIALSLQLALLALRLETLEEAKVILVFHIVGTVMEIYKTSHGSWTYPEQSIFHIGNVPLFSGFMYAAVGSYIARVTRTLNMLYVDHPPPMVVIGLAILVYINFFTHHYLPDIRGFLFLLIGAAFGRTWVYYKPANHYRRMPLLVGFSLVALFIWFGENIGSLTATWLYPHQMHVWSIVKFSKFGSWFLLMIISYALVSLVHSPHDKPNLRR